MIKGKKVKDSAGKWTSSSKKVATVNKNGVVKVTGAGTATIKFTDKKSKKTASVKIYGRVRAAKMMLTPAAVTVKENATADVEVSYELSKKVQAAGAKETTYKLFAESSDTSVATVTAEGTKVTVKGVKQSATPVAITVYAAQVNDLAKAKEVKIKLTEKFDVKVAGSFTAEQKSANTVKVTGTDLTDKPADYVVKNDKGVVLAVKSVKINEDKSATLELDTYQIPDGKYTVTFNKQDAEFVAQKAVVKEIKFTQEDKAIGIYAKNSTAMVDRAAVVFQVFDQFGNDITNTNIPRLNIFGSHGAKTEGKGRIIFTETANGGFQINLSKVSVNVVDLNSGVSKSGMFTVSDIARVSEAKFMGIYNKVSKKFVKDVKEDSNIENNVLLYEVKDQFGNAIEDAKATNELFVNLLTLTRVKAVADKEYVVDVNGKKYIAYALARVDGAKSPTRYGKVDIQAMLVTNGKTLKDTFEITHKTQVDTITFREGARGVNVGEESLLEYTAYDLDGKLITDYETLKEGLVDLKADGSRYRIDNLILEEDKATGKGVFKYDATKVQNMSDALTIPVTINVKTRTSKFSVNTINIRAMRRPLEFVGVKEDVVKGVTKKNTFKLKYSDLMFKDQFGNSMSAADIADLYGSSEYGLNVTLNGITDIFGSGADVKINGTNATNGTATNVALSKANLKNYLLELKAAGNATGFANVSIVFADNDGSGNYAGTAAKPVISKFQTQVYSVALNDMKYFEVKEVKKQAANDLYKNGSYETYTGTTPEYFLKPTVYGYYEGLKIALLKDEDYNLSGGVSTDNAFVDVPSKYTITSGNDAEAVFQIGIHNKDNTVLTTKYTYSKELPKIVKVENNGETVKLQTAAAGSLTWLGDSNNDGIKKAIEITDQYENVVKVAPLVYLEEMRSVASNGTKTKVDFSTANAEYKNDGKTNFELATFKAATGLADGDYEVDLKIVVPNTSFVLRTTVKIHKGA